MTGFCLGDMLQGRATIICQLTMWFQAKRATVEDTQYSAVTCFSWEKYRPKAYNCFRKTS